MGTNCASDLQKDSYLALLVQSLLKNYKTAREIVCSHADNSQKYCIEDILNQMQASLLCQKTLVASDRCNRKPLARRHSVYPISRQLWCSLKLS